MNIKRSVVFAFKAPNGLKKLFIGGVFSLLFGLVYFPFVVMGYLMRVLCDTLEGRDANLPEWKKLSSLFREGLQPVLVVLIYTGPLVLLIIIETFASMALGGSQSINGIFFALRGLYFLLATVLLPLSLIRLMVKNSLAAAFDFSQIAAFITTNAGIYLQAWVISLIISLVAVLLGTILVGFGIFFTTFISNVMAVHLYAQAYRAATPFADDQDGEVRSSLAVPPSLDR
jgi:hypothetical protein